MEFFNYDDKNYALVEKVLEVRPAIITNANKLRPPSQQDIPLVASDPQMVDVPDMTVEMLLKVMLKGKLRSGGHEACYLVRPSGFRRLAAVTGSSDIYYYICEKPGQWLLTVKDKELLWIAIREAYG